MTVNLSLLAGAGWQFFDNNGVPLSGGKLYTYAAGTTTPETTYTSSSGATPNANPIILNAAGRLSGSNEIWLTEGVTYKFVLATSADVVLWTYDNISGANDGTAIYAVFANSSDPTKGDALVGFRQSNSSGNLTGSVGRTVHQKLQEVVSVKDFGAVGDGVADDSPAVQAAINAVGANSGTLVFPPGVYKMGAQINLTNSNVSLVGEKDAVIDFSNFTTVNPTNGFGSNIVLCFNAQGPGQSLTETSLLTVSADTGDYSVTVANSSLFAADAWVQITSNALVDSGSAVIVKQAEVLRVRSVVGNVVNFTTPLLNNYTVANAAKITVVNYIENVSFNNLTFKGKNQSALIQEGLRLNWCQNFDVTNCKFIGFDFMGVNIANSIIGDVNNNYCYGTLYVPFIGNSFYGINIYHSTQWLTVRANKGERVRHLVTSSGTSLQIGEPYFISITGNHTWDNMGGGGGASFAYENHGFGRYMIWSDNTADGCYAGINIERGDNIVTSNYFRNIRYAGIIIGDNVTGPIDNLHITDNTISFLTNDLFTTGRAGVQFTNAAGQTRKNVRISNNKIEYFTSTDVAWVSNGILVRGDASSGKGIIIDGNTIYTPTNNFLNHSAITVDINDVVVSNNIIFNYPRAITVDTEGDGGIVVNNTIVLDVVPAASFAVYLLAENIIVKNNTIKNAHTGVRADAAGAVISDNTFVGCTVNINKADGGADAKLNGLGQLFTSRVYDPPSINSGDSATITTTLTGAVVGHFVTATFSLNLQGLVLSGYVSADNTVTTVLTNNTGAPVDLGSGTLTVAVQNVN